MASGRRHCLKAPKAVHIVLPQVQYSCTSWVVWVGGLCRFLQCIGVGLAFVGYAAGAGERRSFSPFGFVKAFVQASVVLL